MLAAGANLQKPFRGQRPVFLARRVSLNLRLIHDSHWGSMIPMDEGATGREMTDYRPGDHRIVPPRERSIGGWVFLGLAIVLLALGAWVYQFRPQWVTHVYDLASRSLTDTPAQD